MPGGIAPFLGSVTEIWSDSPGPAPPRSTVVAPRPWDQPRWRRGRRLSTSGLFLGWAGLGLAAGGTTLASGGRDTGPLTSRQLLATTVVTGAGIASVGLVLQVVGAHEQRRALPPDHRARPARNRIAAVLAGVGLAGSAVLSWRLLDDAPDGYWVVISAPLAITGTLGATGLHTVTLIEGDNRAREVGVRAWIGPRSVGVEGRF